MVTLPELQHHAGQFRHPVKTPTLDAGLTERFTSDSEVNRASWAVVGGRLYRQKQAGKENPLRV